jgi:hypothetical protein
MSNMFRQTFLLVFWRLPAIMLNDFSLLISGDDEDRIRGGSQMAFVIIVTHVRLRSSGSHTGLAGMRSVLWLDGYRMLQ